MGTAKSTSAAAVVVLSNPSDVSISLTVHLLFNQFNQSELRKEMSFNQFNRKDLLSKAEDVADQVWVFLSKFVAFQIKPDSPPFPKVLRHSKSILPPLGRLCLVSTFIEDGFRMYLQWSEQRDYMNANWGCGYLLASLFVLYNLIGQLGGSAMVLLKQRLPLACGLLFSIVVLQVTQHEFHWCIDWLIDWLIGLPVGFFSHTHAGTCLQHLLGHWLFVQKHFLVRCSAAVARTTGKQTTDGRTSTDGKRTFVVHAAGRPHSSRPDVFHVASIWVQLLAACPKCDRQCAHARRHRRLQDQIVCPDSCLLADRFECLLQLLVDHSVPQTGTRFSEIWFLPDDFRHWRSAVGRLARTRRCFVGRTQKAMVIRQHLPLFSSPRSSFIYSYFCISTDLRLVLLQIVLLLRIIWTKTPASFQTIACVPHVYLTES